MSDQPPSGERKVSASVIAVVVVVVLLIAVGVGVAVTRRPAAPTKPGSDSVHAGTHESSGVPGLNSVAGSGTANAAASASASGPKGAQGSEQATVASRPDAPAAKGSVVTTIAAPPVHTLSMPVVPKSFVGANYDIVFQPFGWGPGGPKGGALAILVVSAKPVDAAARKLNESWTGQNLLVYTMPPAAKAVTLGGTYTGRLFLRKQAGVGVFFLLEAKPK